ncbi:MAG: N4-gp56 family major capsid protein [Comamonadaceae bacterium]|nr:MAG: N4-gp56 family major capsid protein [Comamonadaceae bacterium]
MANTTTSLTQEMMTYLDSDFLEKSLQLNPHRVGFKLKKHTANSGKTINWARQDVPANGSATTPVTEGVTPTAIDLTDQTVSATLAVYGRHTVVTDLLNWTSIDEASNEKKDTMAIQASNVADTLAREVMYTGSTTQFANSRASLATIAAGDNMNSTETRKAVRTLKKNNAMPYEDGYFLGKIGPDTSYDLMGDSVWVNAHTYKDGDNLYQGEVGRLFQVRFVEASSNQKTEASTVTVYSNFIHGKNAFGAVDLAGAPKAATGQERGKRNMQLIVKQDSSNNDTSNPLNLYFTIGWKFVDALATLNSNWSVNVKTAASA